MIEDNASGRSAQEVQVPAGAMRLKGILRLPENARGIVLLSQGSRAFENLDFHNAVAEVLQAAGLATLFVHLLTEDEEALDRETHFFRFNVDILHQRILGITHWLIVEPATQNLSIGYFGGGITAAACLIAAAERPDAVHAVVVGSARTDLARDDLERLLAPTLFIVAENDLTLNMNTEALSGPAPTVGRGSGASRRLERVAGASALFETPCLVLKVAQLASQWFSRHLEPIV
jgi:putative phosphoribosyl transferase